jgi:hypothetical protein
LVCDLQQKACQAIGCAFELNMLEFFSDFLDMAAGLTVIGYQVSSKEGGVG